MVSSSTAQGGGGSFKNGKPIGEVSWCDAKWQSDDVKFSLHLSFDLPLDLSINLSSRHVDNKTMLLDFCWQHQKRSNSARLSQFCSWKHQKRSKTKQFCETFLQNRKLTVQLTASYQCVLRFFHAMSLKYCACHEKVSPGHTKCCTCHEKSILA